MNNIQTIRIADFFYKGGEIYGFNSLGVGISRKIVEDAHIDKKYLRIVVAGQHTMIAIPEKIIRNHRHNKYNAKGVELIVIPWMDDSVMHIHLTNFYSVQRNGKPRKEKICTKCRKIIRSRRTSHGNICDGILMKYEVGIDATE